MKKIIVENQFWNIFPEAKIAIITIQNVDNSTQTDTEYFVKMLEKAVKESLKFTQNENFSENEVIQKWRNAYQKFKTKKGARSSIEALLKRAKNNNQVHSINPMVDFYNCISMTYGVPCGGEDVDKIKGDLLLTTAVGTEEFKPLGSSENESPFLDEIIYKDEAGAICRCLNWREAQRTMLTEDTKNAIFVIEEIDASKSNIEVAANELGKLFQEFFKVIPKVAFLDKNNPETDWTYSVKYRISFFIL
ncbi:B3/B4 domain-containing protein [Spiroplasma alleghenense]|uniref:B3/B4 tRNA-binding domain-containing protein n=1 Tax=Spiroplasma alleghenense TaxID=216931 RepID=A0A345Z2J1_9MOLU|nr:phenylalanine--tRNA ligase beta subunit-related protein [Spiroplasma alleghenense]AXK50820.1 hypothetical protein SALLE_v1c01440 [Spiroplasma alleghenense]